MWREQLGGFKALQLVLKRFRLNLWSILCQIYSASILLTHSQWLTRPIASNRKNFFRCHHSSLLNYVRYVPKCLMCLRVLKYYLPACPHYYCIVNLVFSFFNFRCILFSIDFIGLYWISWSISYVLFSVRFIM